MAKFVRSITSTPERWAAAQAKAEAEGVSLSAKIDELLEGWLMQRSTVRTPTGKAWKRRADGGSSARLAESGVASDGHSQQKSAKASPTGRTALRGASGSGATPQNCKHPQSRRIGDGCPLCGATGLKP